MANVDDDIEIDWICSRSSEGNFPGCADACQRICRVAARLNGWTAIGIRHFDHATTRVRTGRGGHYTRIATDPCIAVLVGHEMPVRELYIGHGHFYIVYDAEGRLPERLAHASELSMIDYPVNPEIWTRGNNLVVETKGIEI